MSNGSAGTQGWYSCEPLSKRRVGKPGPDPDNPKEGSPLYYALKLRTAGKHKDYLSVWEWEESRGSWMLLVLDRERNIVGQMMGRTLAACTRRMNALFVAKGLGIYDRKYADPDLLAEAEAAAAAEAA
jgi:hypothetical protein